MCIEFQNDPVHMSEFHGEGETNIVICLKEQQSCLASDKAAEFENKSEGRRWLWETWEDEHIFSGNGWSEDFWVQWYKKTWKDTWRNSTNPMPPSLHAIAFHLPILNCDILLRLQCCCGKWRDMMKSDLCCCWQLPRVVKVLPLLKRIHRAAFTLEYSLPSFTQWCFDIYCLHPIFGTSLTYHHLAPELWLDVEDSLRMKPESIFGDPM